jgi:hypothetical protein
VNIYADGSLYPKLVQIMPGDTIRFVDTITANSVEHSVTPNRATNASSYFGGLSFYASDLSGLYVPYLEIQGLQGAVSSRCQVSPESRFMCRRGMRLLSAQLLS